MGFGVATFAAKTGQIGNTPEVIKEYFFIVLVIWPFVVVAFWPGAILAEIGMMTKSACDKWVDYLNKKA
jgi:hypothetical protein